MKQPKGLFVLALANTGERFGYYTMLAILLLYVQAKFGLSTSVAGQIYSGFLALVYFLPILGGMIADRWNFRKTVTLGLFVMFAGYAVLTIPTPRMSVTAYLVLFGGLFLICCGTGLFKGNLQVMIGDLYNAPEYSAYRDEAFSLFYMFINIGAMFAPAASEALCDMALNAQGYVYDPAIPSICNELLKHGTAALSAADTQTLMQFAGTHDITAFAPAYLDALTNGYRYAFALACLSLVVSYAIYWFGRSTYAHIGGNATVDASRQDGTVSGSFPQLTPQQIRSRITALLLVFAVVIFFWMVFHQNGATLTKFAEVFTSTRASGLTRIGFNVFALLTFSIAVWLVYGLFKSRSTRLRTVLWTLLIVCLAGLIYFYAETPDPTDVGQPQIFQQFNSFFVVALTPLSLAFFGWLQRRGKEPSAPRKIGLGMLTAAIAFLIMFTCSLGLGVAPASGQAAHTVSPNVLISTYLILTVAELLLSPMGISFVSKVAPPKYKGMMMGAWFGATAIGNYLVSIPTLLWNRIDVSILWAILMGVCLLSASFIFAIMKKLEAATAGE